MGPLAISIQIVLELTAVLGVLIVLLLGGLLSVSSLLLSRSLAGPQGTSKILALCTHIKGNENAFTRGMLLPAISDDLVKTYASHFDAFPDILKHVPSFMPELGDFRPLPQYSFSRVEFNGFQRFKNTAR